MTDQNRTQQAWMEVVTARDEFLSSQDSIIDLMEISNTEASKLDLPAHLAQKLASALGRPDMEAATSAAIYAGVQQLILEINQAQESTDVSDESEQNERVSRAIDNFRSQLEEAGIDSNAIYQVLNHYWKINRRGPRSAMMLEALLITAVSQFEVFISQVISSSVKYNPSVLKRSGREFGFSEVLAHHSIEDFIASAADDYADKIMGESMAKWMAYLEGAVRAPTDWVSDYMNETMQRRHIHVHNGGRVSARYNENVGSRLSQPLGAHLAVSAEYLIEAIDRMAVVVMYVSQAALFAIFTTNKKGWEEIGLFDIGDPAFHLLSGNRHGVLVPLFEKIGDYALDVSAREHLRANCWQARKTIHGLGSVRAEVLAWDISSMNKRFLLARQCLLEDLVAAKETLQSLIEIGEVSTLDLATWPILEPLRRSQTAPTP